MKSLSIAQQADIANTEQRFEKQYAEMNGDSWREEVARKTKALFDVNPHCGICEREIEDVSTAGLFEPIGSKAFILCTDAACHYKAINDSVTRFFRQPRRSVA